MSHLIIKPFDTVYAPETGKFSETWHGLQTNVTGQILPDGSNIPAVFCPIVSAGFKPDFESPLSDVPAELAAELGENPIANWKVILADLRGNGRGVIPLHVAKKGYKIHGNRELFDSMVKAATEVLGANGFEIATVGTLGAYSQFFVSMAIKGATDGFTIGEKDAWKSFFNLVSSHNSLVASQTLLSVIRIVCMNTVQASIADGEETGLSAAVKHTLNSESLITPQAFAANLKTWLAKQSALKASLEAIRATPMSLDGFRSFATGVFTNDGSDNLSTVSFNRVTELETLFSRGKGNEGKSLYDGVNAFTEYFTSGNGVGRLAKGNANLGKRIASANFGRGNEWKLEALRVATNPEEFAIVSARGERYYADKLTIEAGKN